MSSRGGVGFFGLLTIVFITLKLTNVIGWSWWWVLSPLWGAFLLMSALLVPFPLLVLCVLMYSGKPTKSLAERIAERREVKP